MNFRLRGGSDVVARGAGYREGETRGKGARARAERGASKMRESVCPLAGRYAPLPAGGAFPRGSLFHADTPRRFLGKIIHIHLNSLSIH